MSSAHKTATELAMEAYSVEADLAALPHYLQARCDFIFPNTSANTSANRSAGLILPYLVWGERRLNLYVVHTYSAFNPAMVYDEDAKQWFASYRALPFADVTQGFKKDVPPWALMLLDFVDSVAPAESPGRVSHSVLARIVSAGGYAQYAAEVIRGDP